MTTPTTSEPLRIAAVLANDLDGGAAALLVAILGDDTLIVDREGSSYLLELEADGCVQRGRCTSLGARVGLVLRAQYGIVVPPHMN